MTSIWITWLCIVMMLLPRFIVRPSYSWSLAATHRRSIAVAETGQFVSQQHGASGQPIHLARISQWSHQSNYQRSRLFSTTSSSDTDIADDADEVLVDDAEEDDVLATMTQGIPDGWFVVNQYEMPQEFDLSTFDIEERERLSLTPHNVSLPVALMLVAPDEYPSFSRARKVCRKGNVLVKRGSGESSEDADDATSFDRESTIVGRVGDRVYPGDTVGKQVRMGNGQYPIMSYKQPFDLPVVYEDDYFAIVNKPAGVVVYAHRQGGHGLMTIRACLPFALTPPKVGTFSVLRRPQPCHRLDKPTAGLLLVAKTKPAMQNLCKQFADRVVKKTYTAIVNGIPFESKDGALTSPEASAMGVDVDPTDPDAMWQLINSSLEEKESVTLWRSKQFGKSLKAQDGSLTVVELKPKTGRYHQLRRHMAWVCETPIIGDDDYDGGGDAMSLRERGLFLCSNRVTLEHPYYNTEHGRAIWDDMSQEERLADGGEMIFVSEQDNDTIMVTASIDLPSKFESFLAWEQQRVEKFDT